MTALRNCHRCDYELRRIRSDAGDEKARTRMTEAERRRADGDAGFCDCRHCVAYAHVVAECYGADEIERIPNAGPPSYVLDFDWLVIMYRALVLQDLVDRMVAWCEAEVMT